LPSACSSGSRRRSRPDSRRITALLLAARIAIGVGEASFAGLAPAYIDDVAPPHRRNVWLSIFFAATAVGQAAGYGVSGALSAALGWRATFFFETALMAPFVVLFLFVPPPPPTRAPIVAATADSVPGSVANYNALAPPRHRPSVLRQLRELLENPVYVSISLGYAAWMFVIGCLGVFLPAYCHEHLGLDEAVASLAFGATTVVAGIFGTAAGGYIVDHRKGLTPYQRNVFALRMSSVLILLGGAFCCLGAAVGNAAWSFFAAAVHRRVSHLYDHRAGQCSVACVCAAARPQHGDVDEHSRDPLARRFAVASAGWPSDANCASALLSGT
jgi:MFS family permease